MHEGPDITLMSENMLEMYKSLLVPVRPSWEKVAGDLENYLKGGEKYMAQTFNIGDYVWPKDGFYAGCSTLRDEIKRGNVVKIKISSIDEEDNDCRWIGYDKNAEKAMTTCCELDLDMLNKVSSNGVMTNLVELTPEQRELLSDEDQALLELGVLNDKLQLVNKDYVIHFLFKQNKQMIAQQAQKEVAEIKAKAEKK